MILVDLFWKHTDKTELENKIIIAKSFKFNKLMQKNFAARLKHANLVTKTVFDDKLKGFNQKINSSKTKHFLVENETEKTKKNWFNLF